MGKGRRELVLPVVQIAKPRQQTDRRRAKQYKKTTSILLRPMADLLAPLAAANWFISKAKESGERVTAMKLQKLIYYAHGWCLALYGRPLVNEQVEALQYGPVFPSVYHSAKGYGSSPIDNLLETFFGDSPEIPRDDPRIPLFERIWEIYGKFTAYQLSNMTHETDTPWHVTWASCQGRKGTDIPDERLKLYFQSKIKQA